jgi:hypothetical protein
MLLHSFAPLLAFAAVTLALPRADPLTPALLERQDGACTNTPRTRGCWSDGYSISTDFDAKYPPAGTTVTVRHKDRSLDVAVTECLIV